MSSGKSTENVDTKVGHVRSSPGNDLEDVKAHTADNADFHLFDRCVSVVVAATILLGSESKDEASHFNKNFMKGLGKISELKVEDLAATKEEDEYAQSVIYNQSIFAILTAAAEYDWISKSTANSTRRTGTQTWPTVESKVSFTFRSAIREGIVK